MAPTRIRIPPVAPAVFGVAILIVTALLGLVAPPAARWLDDLLERSPLPSPGIVGLIGNLPPAWSVSIGGVLGLAAGAVVAFGMIKEALDLTVEDDHVEYRQDSREGWIERSDVAAVYRDGKELVLLRPDSSVGARLVADALDAKEVERAMRAHGWPWQDQDPYADRYVPWVDGRPGFSADEHAVLRRRRDSAKNAQTRQDVDRELAERGLAVRVQDRRLAVRRISAVGD